MKSFSKSLDVFDFKEEDELTELAAATYSSKFKNPNAIDKYAFLQNVAQRTNIQSNEIGNVLCVDVDAIDSDHNCDSAVSSDPLDAGEDSATKRMPELDAVLQNNSAIPEQHPQFRPNKLDNGSFFSGLEGSLSHEAAFPDNNQLNCALMESPFSDKSVDAVSDADVSMSEGSSSSSSDIAEDDDGTSSDHYISNWDMGDRDMTVVFKPDYVVFNSIYCTDPVLTFSGSCIEIKGSTDYGNQGTFSFHWGIDDIINIESQRCERYQVTMLKIHVLSKDRVQLENGHGTSGIEELNFAVVDSYWFEKQEAITSLDVRYKGLWNVVLDTEIERDGEALLGQNGVFFPKCYFPNFDESFEDVVYPKGDSDAVSISKRDVDLLRPETFVNDTIIDFYIKYLKNKIQPEERHRFHFFNSFFFRKLADLDKDPSSASKGRAAFQRVRKWTRKVNLFEKDYIFVPVNFNYHWSLIVICHPGEVAKCQDEVVKKSLRVPCILHMDSIRGSHTGLKDLVQSYLCEEWKERQKENSEEISSRFHSLRFVSLELPQQQNSFDCGLFLLHYVELFLEEAPVNFSPFNITKFSKFLNVDWFQPAEASLKRVLIQRLIYDILESRSQELSPAASGDKHCTSNCPETKKDDEIAVEFLSDECSPPKICHRDLLNSQAGQGIEITLLPTSSMRSSQCASDSGLILREFFEPGAAEGSFLDAQYQAFGQTSPFNEFKSTMSPVEEEVEGDGHFIYSSSAGTGFQQLAGTSHEACDFPYSSSDLRTETSWNPSISLHQNEHEDIDTSPEASICVSDDSLELEIHEKQQVGRDLSLKEKIDQRRSPSTENIECLTECFASVPNEMLDVSDSGHPDQVLTGNDDTDPVSSCPKNLPGLSREDYDMQENGFSSCEDVRMIGDDSVSESDMQPAAKKMRVKPPLEGEGLTSSLSKDLHL